MSQIEEGHHVNKGLLAIINNAFVGHDLNKGGLFQLKGLSKKTSYPVCKRGARVTLQQFSMTPVDTSGQPLVANVVTELEAAVITEESMTTMHNPIEVIVKEACEKAGCGKGGEKCKVLEAKQARAEKRNQKVGRG